MDADESVDEPKVPIHGRNASRGHQRMMTFGTGSGLKKIGLTIDVDENAQTDTD